MDVTPPSTLRRLGIALAGLAVAALTAAACALSFNDLRELAVRGQARADLAFLYPAAFDALLLVALVGVLVLSSGRTLVRVQAAVVLVVLILAAAVTNLARPLQFQPDVRQAALGVAIAPWVMLAIGLWLWLLMIKHVQAAKPVTPDDGTAEQDLVPFRGAKSTQSAPPLEQAPEHEPELEPTPVIGPTPAPETPPIPAAERESRWEPAEVPVEEKEEEEEDEKPVRWGDRVHPTDVLVHPRNDAPQVTERDADTQPVRVINREETVNPDPEHGPEAADETEPVLGPPENERRQPYSEAPSGRLRSTPLPPEPGQEE